MPSLCAHRLMLRSSLRALTHQTAPPAANFLAVRAAVPCSSAPCCARTRRALSKVTRRQLFAVPARAAGCPACRGWQASAASHAQQCLAHSRRGSCPPGDRRVRCSAEHAVLATDSADRHAVPGGIAADHDGASRSGVSLRASPQPQPWTSSVSIARGEVHVWWLHPDKVLTDVSGVPSLCSSTSPLTAVMSETA